MSLWDDITEKVGAGSKVVADKAKEVSELANLRAQIVSCDNTLVKNFKELGKAYFEAHKDDADSEFADLLKILNDATAKKADLNDQLTVRKAASKVKADAKEAVEDIVDEASDVVDTAREAVNDITE